MADALFDLGVPLALLLIGYFAGTAAEQSHYKSIWLPEQNLVSTTPLLEEMGRSTAGGAV